MPHDFLLEIGVEELPSSFLSEALAAMPEIARDLLAHARIEHGQIHAFGTPRRLALQVTALATNQGDLSEQVVGPKKSVAMDSAGKLTKAGEGFARKAGVDPADIKVITTPKGEYLAFERNDKGAPTADVLPEVLPQLAAKIPFPKSMRWAEGNIAFGRPIHWLLTLHGDAVVPWEYAGIRAGRESRGHRFLCPAVFELSAAKDYVVRLREAHVWVDPVARRAEMLRGLAAAAKKLGGSLVDDSFLVGECAGLVEAPFVVPGKFDKKFLALPDSVVIAVMRDHQRYFALRDPHSGALLPQYLNVVNTANAPERISAGNDRVLRARLADAEFFCVEDKKVPLRERVSALDAVVFQKKLGSVGDKARRISQLSAFLVPQNLRAHAKEAAELAKADLVTLMVGEFPELQGEMGCFYAKNQGFDADVAEAIASHYKPRGASDSLPESHLGAAVAVADRIDTLVGCFGIGLIPSGSADPYALRRAALGIARIALEGPMDVDLRSVIAESLNAYKAQNVLLDGTLSEKLDAFVRARLRAFYAEHYAKDAIDACMASWQGGSIRDLDARVKAIETFRQRPEYEALAVAFKRAFNIAKDAPCGEPTDALLEAGAERVLADSFMKLRPELTAAIAAGDYDRAMGKVASELREPIDRYFEEVFVMVDDQALRDNRLKLLGTIASTLTSIAQFNLLSTSG